VRHVLQLADARPKRQREAIGFRAGGAGGNQSGMEVGIADAAEVLQQPGHMCGRDVVLEAFIDISLPSENDLALVEPFYKSGRLFREIGAAPVRRFPWPRPPIGPCPTPSP
jgi:hypothetical protein